ncbi:MAG: hypothetical protein F6K47_03885 [Symploca sp. SIO2E6]|nr:hypothetical protein [Symploca sp. SIO2E6]
MKKIVIAGKIILLLAINYLATFILALGFVMGLAHRDIFLGAAIGSISLPALLLQPWSFFIVPAASGVLWGPLVTTGITILLYNLVGRSKFRTPIDLLCSTTRSRIGKICWISFVVVALSLGVSRLVDFPPIRSGIPESYIVEEAVEKISPIEDSKYYCKGAFIDSEWLWKAKLDEEQLSSLMSDLGLKPKTGLTEESNFFQQAPYWWNPKSDEGSMVYSTPEFPDKNRGNDGFHALASWSPNDEVMFMWIKDNF